MKNILKKLFVFFIPFLLVIFIINYIFFISREYYYPVDDLIKKDQKYLIGYSNNENTYRYVKWYYLNSHYKKKVLSLGSSRVLQFRREMFNSSFYNAGYTISSICDFLPFLESIPKSKLPEYLIIGLDQWMFNEKFDNLSNIPNKNYWKNSFKKFPMTLTAFATVYKKILSGECNIFFSQKIPSNCIGLNAITENVGFRNDGSIYYGSQIRKLITKDSTARDYNYKETFKKMKDEALRFESSKSFNKNSLSILSKFLHYCKENNIKVIAFLPPYADEVYFKMIKSKKYEYMNNIYGKLQPLFGKFNFELYNYSNVSKCNSSDKETIDGYHGGEVTYLKILIDMLAAKSKLNDVTNIQKLRNDLASKKNNFIVYDYSLDL